MFLSPVGDRAVHKINLRRPLGQNVLQHADLAFSRLAGAFRDHLPRVGMQGDTQGFSDGFSLLEHSFVKGRRGRESRGGA